MPSSRTAVLLALLVATIAAPSAGLAAVQGDVAASVQAGDDDRSRGVVHAGLRKATGGTCTDLYAAAPLDELCTHGPDPAPVGVDVTARRSRTALAAESGTTTAVASAAASVCDGDGQAGPRVQVLLVRAADVVDRWADVAPLVPGWLAGVDSAFRDSAAQTGGDRRVRWVHDAACQPVVERVTVPAAGDDTFSATVAELRGMGFGRTDRKYLLLVDANVYCGIASIRSDDQSAQTNANNTGNSFARVDNGCWGRPDSVEAHEVMHMLGGVQPSAPHATTGWHCTDENDRMCYADSLTTALTYPCAATQERLFDCGHDDYYSTAPVTGSYLATHWNTADSAFLVAAVGGAVPGPTLETNTEVTYTDKMTRRTRVRTYPVTASGGPLRARLSFTGATSMRVELLDAAGRVTAAAEGAGPLSMDTTVPGGSYTLRLGSPGFPTYTLRVAYVKP